MTLDAELREALATGADAVADSDDLFVRVQMSIDEDRRQRRQRRQRTEIVACLLGAVAAIGFATIDIQQGVPIMDWWILEVIWFITMVGMAIWLGPFIKRFGKSYAADVFRSNPRTGKSFIVLMDVAYYLIFFAYILFTVQFEPASDWEQTVNANQLQACTVRLGGIL